MADGLITFHWMPEPIVVAQEYDKLYFEFENRLPVMHEALQVVLSDVDHQFASEGPGWAPWAEATYEDPRANALMERTGALRDGATSEGSYEVTSDFILWTGGAAPAYWRFHWTGTRKMPQRSWIGLTPEGEAEVMVLFETWMNAL